jgi:hypothetical protein
MTIAAAVAFICAVLVHEREVTLLANVNPDRTPLGWLVVFAAALLSFACGASFAAARHAKDDSRHAEELD